MRIAFLVTLTLGLYTMAQNPCASVFVSHSAEAPIRAASQSFSIMDVENLYVHVIFSGDTEGEHIVNAKFFTPHGHLYQQIDIPINLSESFSPTSTRRVPGYPRPIKVQVAQSYRAAVPNGKSVSIVLPVAGTNIVDNAMYGFWSVDVDLDFGSRNCAGAVVFEVNSNE